MKTIVKINLLDRITEARPYLITIIYTSGFLAVLLGHFSSVDANCLRIVGGSLTTIDKYPHAAVILFTTPWHPNLHVCGGAILNERHVLTAAHCFTVTSPFIIIPRKYKIRVGSSMAHSGGTTHIANRVILHPAWNPMTIDSDVAIIRTASYITYGRTVQPAYIASEKYQLADNDTVWAVGWGATSEHGNMSEQLRHVQIWTVNRELCRSRYITTISITDNMLCAGWLGVGGRDQCTRDSGSPIHHHNVVVGLSSMGRGCAKPCYPGINVQISRFAKWIQNMTKPKPGKFLHSPVKLKTSPIKVYFNFNF